MSDAVVQAAALRLIAEHPLAWVIGSDFSARPLPLLAERDEAGGLASLFGHLGRTNPLVAAFQHDPAGLVLFEGPSGYVSPRIVSRPGWAPTWNFAALRLEVRFELMPEETAASLEALLDHLEGPAPDRWTIDRMGARYQALLARIVAFRAHVRRFDPHFKLGQDEADEPFGEIVARHPDRALADWMAMLDERFADPV